MRTNDNDLQIKAVNEIIEQFASPSWRNSDL